MRARVLCGLMLAGACSLATSAAEPRLGKFVSYEMGEFTVITSRGPKQARRVIEDLGKFRITLEKTLLQKATRATSPTYVVMMSRSDWEKYLQPRQQVAGWFQQSRFANYMAMNGEGELSEALHIIFHEYSHFFLRSQFAGEYPPWFNEGLAELMGYAKFTDKGMAVLQIPLAQVHEARQGPWIPFDRMIRVDHSSPEYVSHKMNGAFYAQSWLTVHYGLIENRKFGAQIFAYLRQLNLMRPVDRAASLAFGEDLNAIDKQLRDYSRSSDMHSGGVSLGEIPPLTLPEPKPVSDLDMLAIIIELMIETRRAPDRIRPLVQSLQRREPDSARSAILAARFAQHDDDNAAFEVAVKRAESLLATGDSAARRDLAAVLLTAGLDFNPLSSRTTADNDRDLNRALKWFGEAMTHDPNDVETLWGFGTAATRLDVQLDAAEKALVAAYKKMPASPDIAMSLANVNGRQQDPDAMVPFLRDTIRYATNLQTRQWAGETLVEVQGFIAKRDENEARSKQQRELEEQNAQRKDRKKKTSR